MKKIIVFAGSNSTNSINKEFAIYVSSLVNGIEARILDLNDFPLPVYGIDVEKEYGIPEIAQKFLDIIKNSDGIILSLAEHNGNFSVAFKNMFDWLSRIDQKLWNNKPMLLLSTSPGGRGGASVFSIAENTFSRMGGNVVSGFSLPNFYDNFKDGEVKNSELKGTLLKAVKDFQFEINN